MLEFFAIRGSATLCLRLNVTQTTLSRNSTEYLAGGGDHPCMAAKTLTKVEGADRRFGFRRAWLVDCRYERLTAIAVTSS